MSADNILIVEIRKNKTATKIKKILSQKYEAVANNFVFETEKHRNFRANFIIRYNRKFILLKNFTVKSRDECDGCWYSSKIKYYPNFQKNKTRSLVVSDGDNVDDLLESLKDSGFKASVVSNCLSIMLKSEGNDLNLSEVEQYLNKRKFKAKLTNRNYLDRNEGKGYIGNKF